MRQPFGENLVGGDSWNWTVTLEDIEGDLSGAQLKYFFRTNSAPAQKLDLAATLGADGTFQFTATSEQTSALVGACSWSLCLYDADGNRTELARGAVNVLPDIEKADGTTDLRSWTKRMLDAVTNMLEGRASRVEQEYQIGGAGGGRQVKLLTPDELLKLKGDLQVAYNRELMQSGQRRSNASQIRASFGGRGGPGVWK